MSDGAASAPISELAAHLYDRDDRMRDKAMASLIAIGTPCVGEMCRLLVEGRAQARACAAEVLGKIADEDAADALAQATTADDEPEVRQAAALALGRLCDPRAIGPLATLLDVGDDLLRRDACLILTQIEDEGTTGPLCNALKDPCSYVRHVAARALGRSRDQRAVEALAAALHDPDPAVRESAALALGGLDDPRSVEELCLLTQSREFGVRSEAARLLARMKAPRGIAALVRLLQDEAPYLRYWAAVELGAMGDVRAVEVLCEQPEPAHSGASPHMRRALRSLGAGRDLHRRVLTQPGLTADERYAALSGLVRSGYGRLRDLRRYCTGMLADDEARDGATAVLSLLAGGAADPVPRRTWWFSRR